MFHTFHTSLIVFPPRSNLWATAFVPGKKRDVSNILISGPLSQSSISFLSYFIQFIFRIDWFYIQYISSHFSMVQRLWNLMKCHQVETDFGSVDSKTQISEILAVPYFVLNSEGLLSAHRTSDSTKSSSLHFPKCQNRVSRPKCVRVLLPSLYLSEDFMSAPKTNGVAVHGKTALEENP